MKIKKSKISNVKKNKQNIYLFIAVAIVMLIGINVTIAMITGSKTENNESIKDQDTIEQIIANTNEKVVGDKEANGLSFTNTSLISKGNSSVLNTNVSNLTSSDIYVRVFDIIVKDSNGKIITTLQGYVGGVVPANSSREIISNVDMNLSMADELEYKIVN